MKERLSIEIRLVCGGKPHDIPAGDVRAVKLALTTHSAEGTVEFFIKDDSAHGGERVDKLLEGFLKPDLVTLEVRVRALRNDVRDLPALPTLTVHGVVTERSFREETWVHEIASPVVLVRSYRVRFVDKARALWSQHRPWSLFTQKTLAQALDAERGAVELQCNWDKLKVEHPMIFLGLRGDRAPHFLDFVHWWVAREGGAFSLDHALGTYSIDDKKPSIGEASPVLRPEVTSITIVLPEVCRTLRRVVNVDAALARRAPIDDPNVAVGVHHDLVVRLPTSQQADDEAAVASYQPLVSPLVLEVCFACFPTAALTPGSLLDLSEKGWFSPESMASTGAWRVYALSLDAVAISPGADQGDQTKGKGFEVSLTASLESEDDTTSRAPPHRSPEYPGVVEGVVISESGEDTERTYEFKQDKKTTLDVYRVKLPIFDDQEVNPPYDPEVAGGVLYLPAQKKARVLLSMDLYHCQIVRVLDWREGVRSALEAQSQHLLFGKSDTSQTSVLHDYQDEKPVWRVLRTNQKDTVLMKFEEGRMTLQVKETKDEG